MVQYVKDIYLSESKATFENQTINRDIKIKRQIIDATRQRLSSKETQRQKKQRLETETGRFKSLETRLEV